MVKMTVNSRPNANIWNKLKFQDCFIWEDYAQDYYGMKVSDEHAVFIVFGVFSVCRFDGVNFKPERTFLTYAETLIYIGEIKHE